MIVNPTEEGWEVIYHRAHALLAAQIAQHWHRADRPEHIAETITAIAQHDDLEREWEGDHLSPAGAPLDFTLSAAPPSLIEPWQRLIEGALYRGRWVALLTSMHVEFLTTQQRGQSARLDAFLDEQERLRGEWRAALKVSRGEAERAYAFLQWCDRLSLILCQGQLPDRERWLEISPGPDGVRYDIMQRPDGSLCVEPWPFRTERFTVSVDACRLDQLRFKDNNELVKALRTAPVETLEWTFQA
ncbi:MAG: hypothetical protein OHK0022_48250 [Roseiflexaceae bacterium]